MNRSAMPGPEYEFKAFRYSSHYWILKLLDREKEPVKILDAGTAGGYLGKILKERGHYVAGIEYDAATAEKAKRYYDSFRVADIETFEFPYRREFDYILFADVLEHLRDPAAVLRACIPALKESGKIIISVPNVANIIIRLSLLLGKFDYMDRGILDKTHLRFFTLQSLKKMMNEVPCKVLDVIPTPLPIQIVFPFTENKFFRPLHEILYVLTRSWKTVFAYQFVIAAAPCQPGVLLEHGGETLPREDANKDVISEGALHAEDRTTVALGMTLCAVFVGLAIVVKSGMYSPLSLFLLTIGAILCLAAVALPLGQGIEEFLHRRFITILAGIAFPSTCLFTGILLYLNHSDPEICFVILLLVALGVLQATNLRAMRIPLLLAMVIVFCAVSAITFISPQRVKDPGIDVFLFQQSAAEALQHGHDPYAIRFPNIYEGGNSTAFEDPGRFGPGTPFYGSGVVDNNGWITYGFPYPPLSLLMVMPACLLGGDCRFAYVIAMGLSAIMMAMARPGRWGALVALLLLVNPEGFFVIDMSWTEPMLIFTFSLVMFCACRWRKGLPWALGLFFATKQYTVLVLPALFLLLEGPNPFKQLLKMVAKAGLVVAVITLPFFVWNPYEFIRAVVQWQLVQPFRTDALSYLVWIYNHNGGQKVPIWTPFLLVIPAIVVAIRCCARTPAGFAAAVTLICLTFFAFNKQAFCNYYYFVIGTALWSVAGMWPRPNVRSAAGSATIAAQAPVPLPFGQ